MVNDTDRNILIKSITTISRILKNCQTMLVDVPGVGDNITVLHAVNPYAEKHTVDVTFAPDGVHYEQRCDPTHLLEKLVIPYERFDPKMIEKIEASLWAINEGRCEHVVEGGYWK